MAHPKKLALTLLDKMDKTLSKTRFYVKKRMNLLDPVIIFPYIGYGNCQEIHVLGRVLEKEGITDNEEDNSLWENIMLSFKRYESDEFPHARVRVSFEGQSVEVETDEEGYYTATMPVTIKLPDENIWHRINVELIDNILEEQGEVKAVGEVLIPNAQSKFGIISDIDDTVMISHSTEIFRKAYLIFAKSAKSRSPFPGVSAFYQALCDEQGAFQNPIFYVSSSPWNLYDLLSGFMEAHDIPKGSLLLSDMGVNEEKFIKPGHKEHKMEKIRHVMDTYPDLPFVLVGDSGQKDAEIYQRLVGDYPERVLAIYIRDVTGDDRDQQIKKLAEKTKAAGVDMVLCADTLEAALHAKEKGLIGEKAIESIRKNVEEDKNRPE